MRPSNGMITLPSRVTFLRVSVAATLCFSAACGGAADAAPTAVNNTPVAPVPATISAAAQSYLNAALDAMQTYSFFKFQVAWATVRSKAQTRAAGAQTYVQVYPAIDTALKDMGDVHSSFDRPGLQAAENAEPPSVFNTPVASMITPKVGYVFVPYFVKNNDNARMKRADSLQAFFRTLDANSPCGWIVDLRHNNGGWTDAMLAGVAPLLADGLLVAEVTADGARGGYTIENGKIYATSIFNSSTRFDFFTLPSPYHVKNASSAVAILTDGFTASAGEWTTVALRSRVGPTRSFGVATYGVPTGRYGFGFPDSATLALTLSAAQDLKGVTYSAPLPPDQFVSGPTTTPARGVQDAVVTSALSWISTQPACASGTTLARVVPDVARPSLPMRASTLPSVGPDGQPIIRLRDHVAPK